MIALANNDFSLVKKFRILQTGYGPREEKIGSQNYTVTGKIDNQVGPIVRKANYVLRVYDADPTDPTGADADTEGYGTLDHLRTLFRYKTPDENQLWLLTPASTGWQEAGSSSNQYTGAIDWSITDPGEGTATTAGADYTKRFTSTQFGFSLPGSCQVVGVRARVLRNKASSGEVSDREAYLYYDGSFIGSDRAVGAAYGLVQNYYTYGGEEDTWGAALTPSICNGASFGFGFSADIDASTANVYSVEMNVHYYYVQGNVYLIGSLSERPLSPMIEGPCAVYDVPVEILFLDTL